MTTDTVLDTLGLLGWILFFSELYFHRRTKRRARTVMNVVALDSMPSDVALIVDPRNPENRVTITNIGTRPPSSAEKEEE